MLYIIIRGERILVPIDIANDPAAVQAWYDAQLAAAPAPTATPVAAPPTTE